MKIAVIGAGLMGPAITKDCLEDQGVEEVLLVAIEAVKEVIKLSSSTGT